MTTAVRPKNNLYEDTFHGLQVLDESDASGLPPGVLARIVGPMALYEGESLNGRYYYPKLWESSKAEWGPRLGKMFGTLGHDIPLNEATIAAGQITHKVVDLRPDPKTGYMIGEIHIIDSPAGTEVNRLWRQGWEIGVSTRAFGDVKQGRGKGPGGSDIIDEASFYLQTIDLVLSPGVPGARPQIVESADDTEPQKENVHMNLEKMFEDQNRELVDTRVELKESLTDNQKLNEDVRQLKERVALFEAAVGTPENAKKLNEGLRKWAELEPFKSIAAEVGLFDQPGIGTPNFLSRALQITESYAKKGSLKDLEDREQLLEEYKKRGTIEGITNGIALLEEFARFKKSPKELKKAFEDATKITDLYHGLRKRKVARKLYEKYVTKSKKPAPVTEKWICEMLEKVDVDTVKKSIEMLSETAPVATKGKLNESKPATVPLIKKMTRDDGTSDEGSNVVAGIFNTMNESYSGEKTPSVWDNLNKVRKQAE